MNGSESRMVGMVRIDVGLWWTHKTCRLIPQRPGGGDRGFKEGTARELC